MIKFPKDFLWGAAAAAYQVEGGNANSDWWYWELEKNKEHSGPACRHYELYEQDFSLARDLHHNAHRLSIEWGRIEPEEGKFSSEAMQHYIAVIQSLRRKSIEPLVTLHHFTNPVWFSKEGGWTNRKAAARFLRYCEFVVGALAPHVRYWITINEPMVYITHGYIFGVWPPQERSYLKARQAEDQMVAAHVKAYRAIHAIYKRGGLPRPSVSIAQNMMAFVPCIPSLKNKFAAWVRDQVYNFGFLNRIARHKTLDFIGMNYYSRQLVELKRWGISNIAKDVCRKNHRPVKKNSLGWDIYPEGIYQLLLELKRYRLPVIITENGICTSYDELRWEYIDAHLRNINRAIEQGVPVAGYLYWALLDNFEWDKGFGPRFGMIGVDYATGARTVRESARRFARVCETGALE